MNALEEIFDAFDRELKIECAAHLIDVATKAYPYSKEKYKNVSEYTDTIYLDIVKGYDGELALLPRAELQKLIAEHVVA